MIQQRSLRVHTLFACLCFSAAGALAQTADVMRSPEVSIAYAQSSRDHVGEAALTPHAVHEHKMRLNPFTHGPSAPDGALQTFAPVLNMPVTLQSFLGQGVTISPTTITGDPPDTNGAVGPNHYVQAVNGGYIVFNKSGAQLKASQFINNLWSGYTGTNAGNACATDNDGDPVVMYDQLADRWFITQFSLPNSATNTAPSFQCVAVSKTGDPTGAYWLYDFQYNAVINDYGKFSVWPDGYYATFNSFGAVNYTGDVVCAYDRRSMLAGLTATQQCFTRATDFGILPVSLEGPIRPPSGEPQFLLALRNATSLNFYKFHVDWATPANSTFTASTLTVPSYTELCASLSDNCIAQPAPGNLVEAAGDRLMWRATYRNFGTHESIVVNHSVVANSTGGPRWYEIRTPAATASLFQSGTYSPNDGKYRWMGSIAQDQAQDMALGYSISSSAMNPSVAWTGRTAADAAGIMGQTEVTTHSGTGVETGTFSNGSQAQRWGDYSAMTVDPSDDCTFWYTTEDYYDNTTPFRWDTHVASVKFPNCAQNNFSLSVTPATSAVVQGSSTPYTVLTTLTAGIAESIALNVQDLPSGVTGAFSPATITSGGASTLTLSATNAAPPTASAVTFTVIAKAASVVHAGTASVSVVSPNVPTNVVATATSSTSIGVTWNAVTGATSYQVFRKAAGGAFTLVGSPTTNSFPDSVTANNAYLYKVQAVVGGINSADSNVDLATSVIFTDDPLVSGTTFVKALHLTEIRTALSAVAALAGTGPLTFTDPTLSSAIPVKSVHVTEARTMLNTARTTLGVSALAFANSAAPNTVIAATDFQELRNGVK